MTIVTLPSQDVLDQFGPVPDGIELGVWDLETPHPRPEEVAIVFVPFYFKGGRRWEQLRPMANLRLVQLPSAGYEYAIGRIPDHAELANGRGIHDDETAELAVGLTLMSFRDLGGFERDRERRVWDSRPTRSLTDRRVTVVGYGSIGSEMVRRFEAMRTVVTVVARTAREQDGRHIHAFSELPEIAPRTDILVLITPLTAETTGLVDAELLAALPDGALVVNMARGKVVDTDALVAELQSGRLFAALDVIDPEPLPEDHPLWTTPNTVFTPHVGGNTDLTVPRATALIRDQVTAMQDGRPFANLIDSDEAHGRS